MELRIKLDWPQPKVVARPESKLVFPERSKLKGLAGIYRLKVKRQGTTLAWYIGQGGDLSERLGDYAGATPGATDAKALRALVDEPAGVTEERVANRLALGVAEGDIVTYETLHIAEIGMDFLEMNGTQVTELAELRDTAARLLAESAAVRYELEGLTDIQEDVLNQLRMMKGSTRRYPVGIPELEVFEFAPNP